MSLSSVVCADGGRLVEISKDKEEGQIILREILPNTTIGGHKHPGTNEKWWFPRGRAVVRLEYPDGIRQILTVELGSPNIIEVPAGTGHEIIATGYTWLVYYSDRIYEDQKEEPWKW